MQVLYSTQAQSTGEGRGGRVRTTDGTLEIDLAVPKEMGGEGGGSNPEQLFAAGYAACFHSALKLIGRKARADVTGSVVTAEVGLGRGDAGAFGLAVTLVVDLPEIDRATAEQLVEQAHQVCPYSNAVRGNVEVDLRLGQTR
ncbi:organic hydroperoxide resistance protein [Micromonospora sp. NBC_01699]|uniref:organic hydroperoxide resistance protein n=1 Tax=Micromonospora sp. NBC_01699 TaxID=2975984 RepID=UPI002E370ADC|nr:organic hydroperoxide resistance protein [Micromonospora sp. NBC_01699]